MAINRTRPRFSLRNLLIAVGICALTGMVALWIFYATPFARAAEQRANVVQKMFGKYRSPDGRHTAIVRPIDENQCELLFQSKTGGGRLTFVKDANWCVAWDKDSNLWSYIDQQGVHKQYVTPEAIGTLRPGEFGGWEGIPADFLKQLPESEHRRYRASQAKQKPTSQRF